MKKLFTGFITVLVLGFCFGTASADTFQDFEDGALTGWVVGGRQSGTGDWYGVSVYSGSRMAYLHHRSFTELNLRKTFDYTPGMVLSFDAEFSINGDTSPSASGSSDYYSMVNYQIVLYDSNGVDLGRVSYAAATTRYPYVNRGWTEFTPNGLQHYEYNIPALASQLNVSPDDIHTILLYFNGYSSWWSGHNMIVRFDNVRTHVPIISITPSNHSFGTRALGWTSSQQFSVTNVMNHDITIDSLSLAGVDTQEFEILNDNCTGATLAPQETRTFDVAFTAESLGSKSVTVNISIPGQSADPVPVPLTALVTLPCEGDLNGDGRTDMSDWLLFGQRWGATNCTSVPCACDLNADGRCDMRDWLLFGRSWSRTDCPVQ